MRAWLPLLLLVAAAGADDPLRFWHPKNREHQQAYERRVDETADAESLRRFHDLLASEPHRAGTPGDLAVVASIAKAFADAGLAVEKQELWLYLAQPVAAALEIVEPRHLKLSIKEQPVAGDAYSAREDTSFGWNAYSGSGDVTASVVYANHGTKADFAKLKELGVSCEGKIVVARYGGNFRGYKAKFAEEAGAIGLVIYTDPRDAGYAKGLMYPEGGYANPTCIQRGSILTLPYRGDPLTPFEPAVKDAKRLDPAQVAFPKIPVQPVGWVSATQILSRMTGRPVPPGWQGGLPFTYRLEGGDGLKVRVMVKQERKLTRTFNVTGTLSGERFPDETIVVGAHHDAWGFGAGDPTAGTILVLESARCLATAGGPPARTVVFAAWAAEEYGILGSVEWVEAHRERLAKGGVAYLNLDMAAMGPKFRGSVAPSLKRVIGEAYTGVTGKDAPEFGNLGGGSDHIGFYCHLAIPSAGLSAGGSKGVSYHSVYDNLAWYRKIVGDDYQPALMLTRVVNRTVARLANADLLPLDPVRYGIDARKHLETLRGMAPDRWDFKRLFAAAEAYEAYARDVAAEWRARAAAGEDLAQANAALLALERAWVHEPGLPGRPWYRSLYAATDEDSGYAAWMLPGLRHAVERGDEAAFKTMRELYVDVFRRLEARLR